MRIARVGPMDEVRSAARATRQSHAKLFVVILGCSWLFLGCSLPWKFEIHPTLRCRIRTSRLRIWNRGAAARRDRTPGGEARTCPARAARNWRFRRLCPTC